MDNLLAFLDILDYLLMKHFAFFTSVSVWPQQNINCYKHGGLWLVERGKILKLSQCCFHTINFCMISELPFLHSKGTVFNNYRPTDRFESQTKTAETPQFGFMYCWCGTGCLFSEINRDHVSGLWSIVRPLTIDSTNDLMIMLIIENTIQ